MNFLNQRYYNAHFTQDFTLKTYYLNNLLTLSYPN